MLKILATSDLHSDLRTCVEIIEKARAEQVDCILIAGDLTNFGTVKEADLIFENLECEIPIFLTLGNHDGNCLKSKKLKSIKNITVLIDKTTTFKGIKIFGSPYSLKFKNWWYQTDEKDFKKHLPKEPVDLLIMHQPPTGSFVETVFGEADLGSETLTEYLKTTTAKFCFVGHNHEAAGTETTIGNCKVINCAFRMKVVTLKK